MVDCPASSWKLLLAIGVPFSSSVQVPGPVMSPPISVMVKVPFASGVQEALMEMAGGIRRLSLNRLRLRKR